MGSGISTSSLGSVVGDDGNRDADFSFSEEWQKTVEVQTLHADEADAVIVQTVAALLGEHTDKHQLGGTLTEDDPSSKEEFGPGDV